MPLYLPCRLVGQDGRGGGDGADSKPGVLPCLGLHRPDDHS